MAVPAPSSGASITAPLPSPTIPAAPAIAVRAASALTTPYVFPPECTNVFSLTTGTGQVWTYGDVTETFLYVHKEDATYLSCRPRGLSEPMGLGKNGRAYNVYSGAVCPSGWVAHQVGTTSIWTDMSKSMLRWSTAHCCSGDDALVSDVWSLGYEGAVRETSACAYQRPRSVRYGPSWSEMLTTRSFVEKGSVTLAISLSTYTRTKFEYTWMYGDRPSHLTTNTYTTTGVYTDANVTMTTTTAVFRPGRAFYAPWSIEWVEDDNKTLNPSWPTLTNDMLIPTWQPGSSISRPEDYENQGRGPRPSPEPSIPTKIAIPIIATLGAILGAIVLVSATLPLWRVWRRGVLAKREEEERKWKEGQERQKVLEMEDLSVNFQAARDGLERSEGFEMECLSLDSHVGRDGLGRSDLGSEVNLNSVQNTLPVEGDEVEENRVGRRSRPQ